MPACSCSSQRVHIVVRCRPCAEAATVWKFLQHSLWHTADCSPEFLELELSKYESATRGGINLIRAEVFFCFVSLFNSEISHQPPIQSHTLRYRMTTTDKVLFCSIEEGVLGEAHPSMDLKHTGRNDTNQG